MTQEFQSRGLIPKFYQVNSILKKKGLKMLFIKIFLSFISVCIHSKNYHKKLYKIHKKRYKIRY